mmetsp:Transcript_14667/g.18969  ORF Transcript_14667/g.18969 Transcript_14667/m.18969 type:complete len:220 (+) Transcript_14667:1651-2310(+)
MVSSLKEISGLNVLSLQNRLTKRNAELVNEAVNGYAKHKDANNLRAHRLIHTSSTVEMTSDSFMKAINDVHEKRKEAEEEVLEARRVRKGNMLNKNKDTETKQLRLLRQKIDNKDTIFKKDSEPLVKAIIFIERQRKETETRKNRIKRLQKLATYTASEYVKKAQAIINQEIKEVDRRTRSKTPAGHVQHTETVSYPSEEQTTYVPSVPSNLLDELNLL